ncbi:preprotein translocase subunit SecG [Anaerotignum sp. MB30-C6]|uniref:preprotein translocase subunit SecG n=1 Tax=Anaerotignum sp. MB30-C6 TaxID=3070814 RepID=UPI0027DD746F|nr:preprotein translocase subunit SecG [Anaerotignum sp. MB30-C6]WMI80668.1 preprotein translocase subunit SecG [Anaerotignum sp. MB30-C6]
MTTIGLVLTGILAVVAVVLCGIILMQSKRSAGLGAISASSGGDTYWSKNKGNSVEGALEKYTKIGGALFMIIALAINLVG